MSAAASTEKSVPPQSVSLETFFGNLNSFVEQPDGVAKLRELVLALAVRGKLVPQDSDDEPADVLLAEIANGSASHEVPPQEQPYAIPATWVWSPLGGVADIRMGNSPPGSSYNDSGDGEPLINGPVEFSPGPFGSTIKSKFTTEPNKMCKTGDLLICVRGSTTGRTNIAAFDACIGRGVASIRSRIHAPYLNYVILCMRELIYESGKGSTFKSISQKQLLVYPIPLPPLSEQRRIVAKVDQLLSQCDELEAQQQERQQVREWANRAALQRLTTASDANELSTAWGRLCGHFEVLYDTPETVEDLRQSILQLAVQGKLVPQDPKDKPVEELLEETRGERQKMLSEKLLRTRKPLAEDQLGGPLFAPPEGWGWSNFDEIADLVSGVTKGRKLQGRETKSFPYLRVANVQRWRIDLTEVKEIEIPIEELEKYRLLVGDLVLTEGGDWDKLGRTAIWTGEIEDCLHQNHVFRARLLHDGFERQWVMLYLNSRSGRTYFEGASKRTTNLASINMTQLRGCPIPIPPSEEQKRIIAKLDQLLSQCDELFTHLQERQSTTQRLLSATIHRLLEAA